MDWRHDTHSMWRFCDNYIWPKRHALQYIEIVQYLTDVKVKLKQLLSLFGIYYSWILYIMIIHISNIFFQIISLSFNFTFYGHLMDTFAITTQGRYDSIAIWLAYILNKIKYEWISQKFHFDRCIMQGSEVCEKYRVESCVRNMFVVLLSNCKNYILNTIISKHNLTFIQKWVTDGTTECVWVRI